MYLARFANEIGNFDPDSEKKLGWIKVEFRGQIRWARPCMPLGTFQVPSVEWVQKYGHWVNIYVDFLDEDPADLIWVGFSPLKGRIPPEVYAELKEDGTATDLFTVEYPIPSAEDQANISNSEVDAGDYPYVKLLHISEHLKVLVNEKEGTQKFLVKFSDGTSMLLDRTTDEEKISLIDAKDGSVILIDRTSDAKKIQIKDVQTAGDDEAANELLMSEAGITATDKFDNAIEMTEDGVKVTDAVNSASIESTAEALTLLTEGKTVINSTGDVEINNAPNVKVNSANVEIVGSPTTTVKIGTTAAPLIGFSKLPLCPFTGAPHTTNEMTNP